MMLRSRRRVPAVTPACPPHEPRICRVFGLRTDCERHLAVVGVTRYVSLASMLAIAAFPLLAGAAAFFGEAGQSWELIAASSAIALLVIYRHRENIQRLISGRESRLGERIEET